MELIRAYDPDGTNGELRCGRKTICFTIEIPWLRNQRNISCIPEGRYELKKRFVQKFGLHLLVVDVPDRSWILIHPANDAKAQLKGCIAPVTNLIASGNIVQRLKAPTPKFFRVLRNIGLALAAVGGALLAAPVALPAAIITVAGYITVAGGVMTAVSQTAVDGEAYNSTTNGSP
jgi:hypothetical protein